MQADLQTAAAPDTVTIAAGGRALTMRHGGIQRRIGAATLRRACRCATCTAARLSGGAPAPASDIRLTMAAPIGGYALNLTFSDGHARGVFPFALLADLAAEDSAAATAGQAT